MNAIVTVLGKDRVGIIASVCTLLADYNINVLDVSQTIMEGYFTMIMMVDTSAITKPFAEVANELTELGRKMSLDIRIQREEIFDAMHTI